MTGRPSDWSTLADQLAEKGHSREDVLSLLALIDAPAELPAFRVIATNLIKVLNLLKHIIRHDEYLTEAINKALAALPQWLQICETIVVEPRPFIMKIPDFGKQPSTPGKAPLTDYFLTNGLYVTLWYSAPSPGQDDRFTQLLAQILLAHIHLHFLEQKGGIFESSKYGALLSARNLTSEKYSRYLSEFPEGILPIHGYLQSLRTMANNPCQQKLVVLFNNACEETEGITRNRPIYSRPAITIDLPSQNVDLEQEAGQIQTQLHQMPFLGVTDENSLIDAGCSSGEGRSGLELMTFSFPGKQPMAGRTPAQHLRRMRHKATQTAKQNQQLPSRWESMSLHEVATFIGAISDLFHGKAETIQFPKQISPLELAAYLSTVFWTCSPVKTIRNLQLYSEEQASTATETGFVYQTKTNGYWLKKPASPISNQPQTEEQRKQAVPLQRMLPLHSGLRVEAIINRYVDEIMGGAGNSPRQLFGQNGVVYYRAMSEFIASINSHHNCRITPGRLSDHILEAITNLPGSDLVCAMLITGRSHFLGETPLHYTALPATILQRIYRGVCANTANIVERELNIKDADELSHVDAVKNIATTKGNYIGSRYRPQQTVVQNLISKMQSSLAAAQKTARSLKAILMLHNNLTLYTSLMIGYSTAFRAVREPYIVDSQIDRTTGLTFLTDKDSADFYNARLIWLPPFCLEQFDLYQCHLQNLNDRMLHLNSDLFARIHGYSQNNSRNRAVPLLFFFHKNRQEIELRPASLEKVLGGLFTLPINSNRHYLRSILIERGCPVLVVNAFMGHWERGQEPWGRFSALSPLAYRNTLGKYLLPLLIKDGWRPMSGLGGKR